MKRISLCCSKTTVFTAAVFMWFFRFLRDLGLGNSLWPSLEFLMYLLFSFGMCPTRATKGIKILWKSLMFSGNKNRGGNLCSRLHRPGSVQRWTVFVLLLPCSRDYSGEFSLCAADGENGTAWICFSLDNPNNFGNSDLQSKIWYRKRSNGLSWDLLYLTEFQ